MEQRTTPFINVKTTVIACGFVHGPENVTVGDAVWLVALSEYDFVASCVGMAVFAADPPPSVVDVDIDVIVWPLAILSEPTAIAPGVDIAFEAKRNSRAPITRSSLIAHRISVL